MEIKKQAEMFVNKKKGLDTNTNIDTIQEEDKSEGEDQDNTPVKNKTKEVLDNTEIKDKEVTFVSNHSEELSDDEIVNEQMKETD